MNTLRQLALICVTIAAGSSAANAASTITADKVDLGQPFALQVGASRDVQPPGVSVTLRSLASDSGCLSAQDCSAMLFSGTLVLRLGTRKEFHALDAMIVRDAPYRVDFAGFDLFIDSVQPDVAGHLAATFTLIEHEKPENAAVVDDPAATMLHANSVASETHDESSAARIAVAVDQGEPQLPQAIHIAARMTDPDTKTQLIPIWIEPKQASLSNSGWTLFFHSVESLTRLEVMTADAHDWVRADGEDREFYAGLGFFDAQTVVEVRGVAADGRTLGPYRLNFDALDAVRDEDARTLRSLPATWVEFNDKYVYFSELFECNCGLREVRYSIDSKTLDRRMNLPPCSLRQHGSMPADDSELLRLEKKPDFVAIQLVYYDGTESPASVVREGMH
jgi:hypothetical protein